MMNVSFDTQVGNTILGNGVNATFVGATLTSSAKKGMALNVAVGHYIDFGTYNDSCLGNISACSDSLTLCMWVQGLEEDKWGCIFKNHGGMKLCIKGVDPNILIHLYCVPPVGPNGKKYKVTVSGDITGYNHYCISCTKTNKGKVYLNGEEYIGTKQTSSSGEGSSGEVRMGDLEGSFSMNFNVDELDIWLDTELDAESLRAFYEGYAL